VFLRRFALAYFCFDKIVLTPRREAALVAATEKSFAARPSAESNAKAIAVLPFVNMSADKEQDYFSDGLSEELLNQLAQIPQLRVIARTSSFSFKGKEVDVATIAKALNVGNVLEGSVRKSANTLRITAQLVRTSDSSHLWSQTYDREMTDVFKVQDEIAGEVVAALKVKLLPTQQPTSLQRTSNSEAYEQFLIGTEARKHYNSESLQRSVAAFQRAVALDPNYANAYAALAEAQVFGADFTGSPTQRAVAVKQAFVTVEKAVALAPDLAVGYGVRGTLRSRIAWDLKGARDEHQASGRLGAEQRAGLDSLCADFVLQWRARRSLRHRSEGDDIGSVVARRLERTWLASCFCWTIRGGAGGFAAITRNQTGWAMAELSHGLHGPEGG